MNDRAMIDQLPMGPGRRITTFLAVVGVAASLAVGAYARSATTAPTKLVTVLVLIDEKGIKLSMFTARDNQNTLDTISNRIIPRGDYVTINVLNRGKKHHDFTFMGKRTPLIKPGGRAHLFVVANSRGQFKYSSTLDRGKHFRGSLTVA
jgi:hypothetical protein